MELQMERKKMKNKDVSGHRKKTTLSKHIICA